MGKKTSRFFPPDLLDLVCVEDRISFLYFEHAVINRDDNAITVRSNEGVIHVPSAALGVLMLGPGINVTHQAMTVIGQSGATVIWVGERGVRMYAFGRPLTHSSLLLQRQAKLASNGHMRLDVARRMYQMRFPHEDVSALTMRQLRGREGARVRGIYRKYAKETGVCWNKCVYDPANYEDGTEINKALSAAHACLYGISHAAIVALGCSPGLGFVHTGHEKSFVYDIADLYKSELSVPVAFRTAAESPDDIGSATRHNMRDAIYDLSIMDRIVHDIKFLLTVHEDISTDDEAALVGVSEDILALWDEKQGTVSAGTSYADDMDESSTRGRKESE